MTASSGSLAPSLIPPQVWRLTRGDDFELHRFDDGAVLHDDLGASVLLISPVAGEIISFLMSKPAGVDARSLALVLLGEDLESDDLSSVENLLQGLKGQGLVECRSL